MPNFHVAAACPQAPLLSAFFHEWIFPDGTLWTRFYKTPTGYLLRFPDLADFEVSADGYTVSCQPALDVSDSSIQHLYLNQVLPLALGRQGKLVFHAGAVEIDGGAVAFMGESGRGKSTLVASFSTTGHRFLTDDGLVLEQDDNGYQAMPSHPSIRLWEDSEQALINVNTIKSAPVQFTSKSRFLADDDVVFCEEPRRLQRVYFLGEGVQQQPVFERMNPTEALIELVKHSFLLDIEAHELLTAHFDELSRLVSQSIYYRLDYPRRFEDLPSVRQAIVKHVMNEV